MPSLTRLTEQEQCPACNNLTSVTNERLNDFLEVEHLGLSVDERHHIDANDRLQLRLCVQVIQYNIANFTSAQLDNNPQSVFVGFIAKLGNALDLLLFNQLGNALEQTRLVQLVRNLVDDDRVLALGLIRDHFGFRSHVDAPSTRAVRLNNSCSARDNGPGGEIRSGDITNELVDTDFRIVEQGQTARNNFAHVVRRNIGRHTNSNPRRAIDQ